MFKIKKLKNFGVIESLEDVLELKDFTIFMGDNSAGKSYLAMLINSFVTMSRGYYELDLFKAITSKFKDTILINNLKKAVESILNKSNNNLVLSFTSEELLELKEIIYFSLNDFLLRKYLCQTLFEAQNIDEIEIELSNLDKFLPKELFIINSGNSYEDIIEFQIDNTNKSRTSFQGQKTPKQKLNYLLRGLIGRLLEITTKHTLPINSVYLPASRTGYLQTYRKLSSNAIINTYSVDENKDTLSVIIRFFIAQLNTATNFEKNKFAEFIENYIINGKVDIYTDKSEIEFRLNDGSHINLNYLSSTVSELIPLVVFLKRGIIKKDGLLVIEEPEAHLSFKNQGLISKLIAMLLQNKIKVLITTHSDFLIYSINNLILKNMILKNKDKIQKIDFDDDISIDYKKVALYNFILNSNNKSSISKIKIIEDGIKSDYIFNSIYEVTKTKNNLLDMLDSINANN